MCFYHIENYKFIEKENKQICYMPIAALQDQKSKYIYKKTANKGDGKNTFLSLFNLKLCGGLSLEAAIVLPILLISILSIYYYVIAINFNIEVQNNIYKVAENVGKYEYLINKLESDNVDSSSIQDEININPSFLKQGISLAYLFSTIVDSNIENLANNIGVVNGKLGISVIDSSLDSLTGINSIVVNYTIKNKIGKLQFKMCNNVYFRGWIGKTINKNSTDKVVYITKNGTVYHTNRNCKYLNISINKVNYKEIDNIRNKCGGIYYRCPICCNGTIGDNVYVTDYGDRYHITDKCSAISRDIMEIDISEIGNRKLCERCKNGK